MKPMPRRQEGAVLFVCLVMLLLMTALGITAMQVTTLQERMAGNYESINLAFHNSEANARAEEHRVRRLLLSPQAAVEAIIDGETLPGETDCPADPVDFTSPVPGTPDVCSAAPLLPGAGSMDWGEPENNDTDKAIRVVAIDYDRDTDPTSVVVIETYFIP